MLALAISLICFAVFWAAVGHVPHRSAPDRRAPRDACSACARMPSAAVAISLIAGACSVIALVTVATICVQLVGRSRNLLAGRRLLGQRPRRCVAAPRRIDSAALVISLGGLRPAPASPCGPATPAPWCSAPPSECRARRASARPSPSSPRARSSESERWPAPARSPTSPARRSRWRPAAPARPWR